jgi:hypothetical protein
LSLAAPLPYNEAGPTASEMDRAPERAPRVTVRVSRSSRLREAAGLGIVGLAVAAATLIVAGPSLVDPKPEETVQARGLAVHDPPGALPNGPPVAAPRDGRAQPLELAANARAKRDASDPIAPPPRARVGGMVPAVGLRGPLTPERIAAAIDRAIEKGWLTVDPPGSPPSGMALFPPMGTQPLREGIVVPEGFELPPGYVRHYQVTDGGRQLRPILMFSPDYEWVNDRGEVVPMPADRIVPPEMAPEGMPLERLKLPREAPPWP